MADGAARDSAYAASVAAERERDRFDTVGPRFVAGLVDALVFLPVAFVDSYMAAPERGILVLLAWGLVSYSVYWLYSVLLHARYGQTVGKMVARVKVLDVSEGRIPTPQPGIPVVRTDTHSPLTA